ncbi:MAG: hypothetical protein KJ065_25860 [Anaerolineae bacterium]|nr:hypothetical protein [Anaerolineae bacterium]
MNDKAQTRQTKQEYTFEYVPPPLDEISEYARQVCEKLEFADRGQLTTTRREFASFMDTIAIITAKHLMKTRWKRISKKGSRHVPQKV